MNSHSKKGDGNAFWILISIIVGLLLLLFVVFPSIGKLILIQLNIISSTNTCGNTIVGKGTCKATCSSEEVKIKGYGCEDDDKGTPLYCCINPDYKSEDYGGNNDYGFDVFDVGLDDSNFNSNCVQSASEYTYTCKNGNIKVKMSVTNIGRFSLNIFANPNVEGTYPKQGIAMPVKPGETKLLTVDLSLNAKKSYIIKASAKCNTEVCKDKFGNDGIFRQNDNQYITVIVN